MIRQATRLPVFYQFFSLLINEKKANKITIYWGRFYFWFILVNLNLERCPKFTIVLSIESLYFKAGNKKTVCVSFVQSLLNVWVSGWRNTLRFCLTCRLSLSEMSFYSDYRNRTDKQTRIVLLQIKYILTLVFIVTYSVNLGFSIINAG